MLLRSCIMYLLARKRTVLLFTILISTFILLLLNLRATEIISNYFTSSPYFINWTFHDDISCHYMDYGDALPLIEHMAPPRDSIFFHETSCRGGLNSRQACSVESAARKHPHRNVYVLFNSPISKMILARSSLGRLLALENVFFARVHTAEYAKGTALEELLSHNEINESLWKIEHTADMLRFITIYKYGGIYLDTDMLVVKPLDPLGDDWIAREDENLINVAAFAASPKGVGHIVVANVLMDVKVDYRPQQWVHNGPGAMSRVLMKFCNASDTMEVTTKKCHGYVIYNPDKIYPVHYKEKDTYFQYGELPEKTQTAYMHHMWNRLSKKETIVKDSPYDKLTLKHCPSIRKMYGDRFGRPNEEEPESEPEYYGELQYYDN